MSFQIKYVHNFMLQAFNVKISKTACCFRVKTFVYIHRRMAVNFIKINLFRHPLLVTSLPTLWNVYTQILRHNSENKGENQVVKSIFFR
jgi:hypothetical protein